MKPKPEKIQNSNPRHLVSIFLTFEHLDLFRISDLGFRASTFVPKFQISWLGLKGALITQVIPAVRIKSG